MDNSFVGEKLLGVATARAAVVAAPASFHEAGVADEACRLPFIRILMLLMLLMRSTLRIVAVGLAVVLVAVVVLAIITMTDIFPVFLTLGLKIAFL